MAWASHVSETIALFQIRAYCFSMTTETTKVGTESLNVARNIRAHAAMQKVSLRDLSEKTGISVPTLSRMVRGDRTISVDQMEAIGGALGLEHGALLKGSFDV